MNLRCIMLAMMACVFPTTAGAATLNATPSTFAAQVNAAQSGDTVLLSAGNYGVWSGTNKAITVKADSGTTALMAVAFNNGDSSFILDGVSGLSGDIENDAHDITIKNATTDNTLKVFGDRSGPVVFDNVHFDAHANDCANGCLPALWIGAGGTAHDTKILIKNSLFTHSPGDGIQSGSSFTVIDSEFHVTNNGACGPCHTDSIQLYSGQANDGTGTTILRNYIHDGGTDSDGIVQFDGGGHNIVEDNVIAREQLFGMDFGGDRGSRIVHNTVVMANGRTGIDMTSKAGQTSTGYTLKDNVAPSFSLSGSMPAVNTNNMLGSGASGSNFTGNPVFVGGSSPTTYADFALASGSPGKGMASDGLDVGIRVSGSPPPPPPPPPPPTTCDSGDINDCRAQIATLKSQLAALQVVADNRLSKLTRIRAILDE